jgi:hypothetical protein
MRTVIPSYHWFLPIISGPCELRPLMISVVCDIVSPVVLSSPYHMTGPTNQNISYKTSKETLMPRDVDNGKHMIYFILYHKKHSKLEIREYWWLRNWNILFGWLDRLLLTYQLLLYIMHNLFSDPSWSALGLLSSLFVVPHINNICCLCKFYMYSINVHHKCHIYCIE